MSKKFIRYFTNLGFIPGDYKVSNSCISCDSPRTSSKNFHIFEMCRLFTLHSVLDDPINLNLELKLTNCL